MNSDIFSIFYWWLVIFSLGLIFLPLTSLIFSSFFDKGYALSKVLALLLVSYTIWLLASLKIVPFNALPLFIIIGIFLIINSVISSKTNVFANLRLNLKVFLLEEVLFILGFIFWAYIRSFEPSIHGLEKYMDFGFINSLLRSTYFPPLDIWMPPYSINYYYFGHLTSAVLIKLTNINPATAYNLVLAMLFGLTFSVSFSIGANLLYYFKEKISKSTFAAGLLSAFIVTLGGNLHTIYAFFQSYTPPENPIPFWQLPLSFNFLGYWYPNATRFIPFTIHEFPSYSFVVADLHGHVLNIPFVLFTIALLIKIFASQKLLRTDYLLLALLIAASLMTNVLDGPIYLLVILTLLTTKKLSSSKFTPALLHGIKDTAIIGALAIVFSLPFWINFKPFSSGVGVLCMPSFLTNMSKVGPFLFEANHCARSPLWMLIILWGFFYALVLSFIFLIFRKKEKHLTDYLVMGLAAAATFLILIPEFFYVKDIYPAHYRANTVFKLGYQAFIILGLISGYLIVRTASLKKLPYYLILVPLFFLVSIYPYFSINSYYGELKNSKGLNGLKYLSELYPADYRAILWIQANLPNQPVILEGQGDSYTDFARVSSNTGLPTVIGWPVHEWLWRGSYDEAGRRGADVAQLYESKDINFTKQLLSKYNVAYVFVGALERQKYLNLNETKFQQLGQVIFEDTTTRIYKLNKP